LELAHAVGIESQWRRRHLLHGHKSGAHPWPSQAAARTRRRRDDHTRHNLAGRLPVLGAGLFPVTVRDGDSRNSARGAGCTDSLAFLAGATRRRARGKSGSVPIVHQIRRGSGADDGGWRSSHSLINANAAIGILL
jgi:hypothetical protein